jgi:glycosyltransferase involved in cell wall biosynthesis
MKVLFIAPSFPIPAHSGGAIATLGTLQSIHSLCEVHLLVPPPESGRAANEDLLRSLLPDISVSFYSAREVQPTRLEMYTTAAKSAVTRQSYWASIWLNPELRAAVESLIAQHRFDLVHCEWLEPAVSLRELDLPLLIRTLDVHFVGMCDWADGLPSGDKVRKSFWRTQAQRFRRFEAATLAAALTVVTLSAEDEAVLRGEGVSNIITIPPPSPVRPSSLATETDESCLALFIGRLDMSVNREGFFLFADKVWPHVSAEKRKQVKVIFAGGFPDEQVRRRASECGIEIHAPLSDAEANQLFVEAEIFLSPVASGTGIKIKTLEAMAHGKPMLGFVGAFRGVPIEHGVHALIANSPEEFARLFEGLISDRARRREIGGLAREFVRMNFDPAILAARLVSVYSTTAESYRQGRLRQSA